MRRIHERWGGGWEALLALCLACAAPAHAAGQPDGYPPVYEHWESLYAEDGLPDDHVFWVEADPVREGRIWLGTEGGLACYHTGDGSVEVYSPAEGLGHRAVMSVAVDPVSGDVWAATFGGLSRVSGGKVIQTFTQMNSGLANDVVFSVVVAGEDVWAATTAGTSRYDTKTGAWEIYTSLNMPAEENWCYNLSAGGGKVFIAAWGGGIIEYDIERDHFRDYLDPDGEFEIELFPNDGLVHNITTSPSFEEGLLWATTYFGLSVYDFRRWESFFDHDSGLASNFINFGRGEPGTRRGWICTDKGLSVLDYDSRKWVTYKLDPDRPGGGIVERWDGGRKVDARKTNGGLAHRFVLSIDFAGGDVWVGTSHGLSHGLRTAPSGRAR